MAWRSIKIKHYYTQRLPPILTGYVSHAELLAANTFSALLLGRKVEAKALTSFHYTEGVLTYVRTHQSLREREKKTWFVLGSCKTANNSSYSPAGVNNLSKNMLKGSTSQGRFFHCGKAFRAS